MSARLKSLDEPWKGLGDRLKRSLAAHFARTGKQITGAQLAKAVGRSEATVSLWMNGQSYPNIEQAWKLAKAVGVPGGWLLYNERSEREDLEKYAPADEVPVGAYETIDERDRRLAAKAKALKSRHA